MGLRVAVVGATGNVGRELLALLAELNVPVAEVAAIASRRSMNREISFGNKTLKCQALDYFDFSGWDICLMSAGGKTSKEWSPKIAAQGCIVIDNSSQWRMDPDVPLVVPEVNPDAVMDYKKKMIIANPNCSTAQLVVALKPLHDLAKITRVVIATYQSVSGTGKEAMDELWTQTRGIFVNDPVKTEVYPKQIAFNVIPHGGDFMEDGYTSEELKLTAETKKILDPKIKVTATVVRVPVFVGHCEAVHIEFESPITEEQAREALEEAPGLVVLDRREAGGYMTPVECVGDFPVYVSRIRTDPTVAHGLAMWVVADNLRKGAALNAIQIAQLLVERGVFQQRLEVVSA
ncbi:aspartate-semialdehyde dehydrogenase [Candidatus Phycosocius spiralis]|uniref:Aspartate-semialdehyde dehydrogenase n=1 Tax=Candidatus Phycosocius spiralis TaxID=2815099 RepID=A0ABQ4PTV3_9PROT|nr:aspartate-semialdehyde dehydrogenase [Candidatus Phycosocius spiralis]GIU66428.1 aspartate-semialdehyde dehydrogenase [Candidatus Phycosocius spiralis]